MASKSKEIKIGLIVIVGIAIAIFGINYLKGSSLLKKERTFYAMYDNVEGLITSNPITLNGFKVGRVNNVQLMNDNSGRLMVTLGLTDKNVQVTENTIFRIISSDLLGSKAVEIVLKNGQTELLGGDTVKGEVQESITQVVGQEIEPLKAKVVTLLNSVDSLVSAVNMVLNPDAVGDINSSLYSVSETLENLKEVSIGINEIITEEKVAISNTLDNLEVFTGTLAKSSDNIENLSGNLVQITDSLAKADLLGVMESLDRTTGNLENIVAGIDEGKGSLGKLLKSDTLHNQMVATTEQLESLFEDIERNPKKYVSISVFGGKQKGLMLTEDEQKKLLKILNNTP